MLCTYHVDAKKENQPDPENNQLKMRTTPFGFFPRIKTKRSSGIAWREGAKALNGLK